MLGATALARRGAARAVAVIACLTCAAALLSAGATDAGTLRITGQNVHFRILGGHGPAVVFEAGLGNDLSTWREVAPAVAQVAKAFLYDRAGLGGSLPLVQPAAPVTAGAVAATLHELLMQAALQPPYILVGHSLGGLYVQMFARRWPREVAGVVLLDSASPDAPPELKTRPRLTPGTAAWLEEEGVPASNAELHRAGPFPDVPLVVIAATNHGAYFRAWEGVLMRLQRQLTGLSPKGRLVVAQGSGHDVQTDQPALVISTIRSMVAQLNASERSPS